MLASTPQPQLPNGTIEPVRQDLFLSKHTYRRTRSDLIALAEDANRNNYAIHFENIDELLTERAPQSCTHHMTSCMRQEDYLFELCTQMKAIESSTRYNQIPVSISIKSR